MARFTEGDGFETEEEEQQFFQQMADGYENARPLLREFLSYLDAMPIKRVISSRFVGPGSRDMCAVATFCASRNFEWKRLLEIEKQSRIERFENLMCDGYADGDGGHGWDGATIAAGEEAGLPAFVAYNLAWKNDMVWDHVTDRYVWQPATDELITLPVKVPRRDDSGHVVRDPENGNWIYDEIYGPHVRTIREAGWQFVLRDITPEERWLLLRNHVAKKVGEPALPGEPQNAEWPKTRQAV